MEEDIKNELTVTDDLTKLSSKVAANLKKYSELEEAAIEVLKTKANY